MGWVIAFLTACLVSFLPASARERFRSAPLAAGTAAAGAVQAVAGWAAFFVAGLHYCMNWWPTLSLATLPVSGNEAASGAAAWIFYLLSPTGLITAYVALEGLARFVSGFAVGEPLGSGPIWIGFRLYGFVTRPRAPDTPPPRDVITAGADGSVLVECAAAPGWDELATVELDGALFRVAFSEERPGQTRPHAIRLEPIPHGWIVRKQIRYER